MPKLYHIVCVTKRPAEPDVYRRVQLIGTNTKSDAASCTATWSVDEVIRAIERGEQFLCRDLHGDSVRVFVATRGTLNYLATETDGLTPENILALPECQKRR